MRSGTYSREEICLKFNQDEWNFKAISVSEKHNLEECETSQEYIWDVEDWNAIVPSFQF